MVLRSTLVPILQFVARIVMVAFVFMYGVRWANDARDAAEAAAWIDRHPGLVMTALGIAALLLLAPSRFWNLFQKSPRFSLSIAGGSFGVPPRLLVRNIGSVTAHNCSVNVTSLTQLRTRLADNTLSDIVPFRLRWKSEEADVWQKSIPPDGVDHTVFVAAPSKLDDFFHFNDVSNRAFGPRWWKATIVVSNADEHPATASIDIALAVAGETRSRYVQAISWKESQDDVRQLTEEWEKISEGKPTQAFMATVPDPDDDAHYFLICAHNLLCASADTYEGGAMRWASNCDSIMTGLQRAYDGTKHSAKAAFLVSSAKGTINNSQPIKTRRTALAVLAKEMLEISSR